ncbi:Smr/MutS family protein [Altericroceibacterium endophyticum]|uniref:DNA mismatch repair protein MutS n=1 Tax=Altericroceibacterium endophyticum TaxID=1808508 RepID=A0A6I4T589_9SPHN|nr:Smr/MutS family protein [Altericroceibacterium endophyticum]MXO65080.1 DNA mismatch repair protein MutS [Altericroceibacterium endophyticum]
MKPPRGLSDEEAILWSRVTATVEPIHRRLEKRIAAERHEPPQPAMSLNPKLPPKQHKAKRAAARPAPAPLPSASSLPLSHGLDSSWERKLTRAGVQPDFTLDLHGHTLDGAYQRLQGGLAQARAMGARVVLVVTGKPRSAEAADRGERRGAIRAKILDWLAVGSHAGDIAAIRKAHPRHGGAGALYIILRRQR